MTGMRHGEVLGLRWRDVDLERARLSVRQALVAVGYEVIRSTPKSHNARVIDLDAETVAQLRAHRARQDQERAEWDADYEDQDLVVAKENGQPIHPHSHSQAFERIVTKSNLRTIRLHDLRHMHATLALKAGVPVKVISDSLGHESPAFTLKQYAHVIPGMQAEAAAQVASLVDGHSPMFDIRLTKHENAAALTNDEGHLAVAFGVSVGRFAGLLGAPRLVGLDSGGGIRTLRPSGYEPESPRPDGGLSAVERPWMRGIGENLRSVVRLEIRLVWRGSSNRRLTRLALTGAGGWLTNGWRLPVLCGVARETGTEAQLFVRVCSELEIKDLAVDDGPDGCRPRASTPAGGGAGSTSESREPSRPSAR